MAQSAFDWLVALFSASYSGINILPIHASDSYLKKKKKNLLYKNILIKLFYKNIQCKSGVT